MRTVSRRELMAAGAGIVPVFGLAGLAAAQQTQQSREGREGALSYDPVLASCLLISGRKQIEVCRFAQDRLQTQQVKDFAQAEIEEHETLKKRLAELGYEYPTAAGSRENAGGQGGAQGAGAQGGAQGAGGQGGGRFGAVALSVGRTTLPAGIGDVISIDHEVAEQCIATTKSEQSQLEGLKFEKRFVGSQLDAHYALFDHGVVFRKHASQEMAPVLDEARQIIERHIATCKQLMETLDQKQQ